MVVGRVEEVIFGQRSVCIVGMSVHANPGLFMKWSPTRGVCQKRDYCTTLVVSF